MEEFYNIDLIWCNMLSNSFEGVLKCLTRSCVSRMRNKLCFFITCPPSSTKSSLIIRRDSGQNASLSDIKKNAAI